VKVTDGLSTFSETFSIITGTNNQDTVPSGAQAGDDVILAQGDDDVIFAGSGNDTVFGQSVKYMEVQETIYFMAGTTTTNFSLTAL
jgi:Ca2+-binding RTX toxin-like protein